MLAMGHYPSHSNRYPPVWVARAGATIDDAPLPPKTADRTRAIRRVFLEDCRGSASITAVGDRCDDLGLLDGFSTHRSAYESIAAALRPIATPQVWEHVHGPATVSPGTTPGHPQETSG